MHPIGGIVQLWRENPSDIIQILASKSLSFTPFGVPGLKKVIFLEILLVSALVFLTACGGGSTKSNGSGLSYRAFISNPLFAGVSPALQIVDAQNDTLSPNNISLSGELTQPSMMTLSPSRQYSMVYSPVSPAVAIINNSTEGFATTSTGGNTLPISLPGLADSMFIANDNATGYIAVPSAPNQNGQLPGAVFQMQLFNSTIAATIPIPSAHYIVSSKDGNTILVFSDNSDAISVISTILIGTNSNPVQAPIASPNLDRPVGAVLSSDGSVAYILNCGPECGGKQASVVAMQMSDFSLGTPVPVQGATIALLNNSTLYVAGSAPNTRCGGSTAANYCGDLNVIDTNSMSLINSSPISITDGWHNHMELSADGKLFIGAHNCSSVNVSGGEVRGCLTIYDSTARTTVFPAFVGDVTGIAPILGRQIVYVVQNGVLNIFDTTTDQIEVQNPQPLFIGGLPFDVKYVDPPIPN